MPPYNKSKKPPLIKSHTWLSVGWFEQVQFESTLVAYGAYGKILCLIFFQPPRKRVCERLAVTQ